MLLIVLLLHSVLSVIDDENPDGGNFCVLDANGDPVNCNVDDVAADDGFVRSSMECSGVEKGSLLTTCRFQNICYDNRDNRPYILVKEHDPHLGPNESKNYDGTRDWLFFSDDASTVVPRIDLVAHNTENEFAANVTRPSVREADVEWMDGTSVFIYRQYLINYYHIVMDDMIGIWWTIQHHLPHQPRDTQFVFLDDHIDTAIDTLSMMKCASSRLRVLTTWTER